MRVQVETGDLCSIVFDDAPVTDPILSMAKLNDSGPDVMYQKRGGYVEHLKIGQRVKMHRCDGVGWVKLKIIDPADGDSVAPFHRQGP